MVSIGITIARTTDNSVAERTEEESQAYTHHVGDTACDEPAQSKGCIQNRVCNVHELNILSSTGSKVASGTEDTDST